MDELLGEEIHVIELHMMDLRKFFPLTAASNAAARTFLYPLHLVRTHLQTQVGKQAYKGTWDAIKSKMVSVLPENVPRMLINCLASPLAGMSAAAIMNPVDVVRVRMQTKCEGFLGTYVRLCRESGYGWVFKGMSARTLHAGFNSMLVMFVYESVKRVSLKPEYQGCTRW
ncbi:S2544-like protein [Mya arenaria]|uniref:S2544-like protein n=1 Tax=Mya arenaria TaxID=6604 RepID=A0ABY7E9S9_MYAAR|nr:S2544-like protein [Mya arenaria]